MKGCSPPEGTPLGRRGAGMRMSVLLATAREKEVDQIEPVLVSR
jgi:hypothetical protein